MKIMICLIAMLAITNYTRAAICTMAITDYCQSCDAAACTKCYTWGNGTYADKTWATSTAITCTSALPSGFKVTNCLVNYSHSKVLQNATSTVAITSHPRCVKCDGKKFLHFSMAATTETCTDTAPTDMASCVEIANCMQTMCKTDATTAYGCVQCDYDKYPTAVSTTTTLNTACGTVVTAINNCILYSHTIVSGVAVYNCSGCASGYVTTMDLKACLTFTDEGCKSLQMDNTSCGECWWSYAFSGSVCLSRSYVGALAGLISFVALLLVQ